ncbi:lipase [Amanita rubescens]|nr:lipase [Amanita rubescens]
MFCTSRFHILLSLLCVVSFSGFFVFATPLEPKQSNIASLSPAQIDDFTPYTRFASIAYCPPNTTLSWSCGADCQANPDFKPVASGGDGASVQFWYVGYSPSLNEVIVAHQGTDISKFQAVATDIAMYQRNMNATLFPNIDPSIKVHDGFQYEQAKTATNILSNAQSALSSHNATVVTVVGHSLGAAIALLNGIYLKHHLPDISIKVIGYGLPRVGNQAFADYVDANIVLKRVNNMKDPVPTMPPFFMGYRHPCGEYHITETSTWMACPGQDNPSTSCIVGDVPDIFASNIPDHYGPYNGISMGCSQAKR